MLGTQAKAALKGKAIKGSPDLAVVQLNVLHALLLLLPSHEVWQPYLTFLNCRTLLNKCIYKCR